MDDERLFMSIAGLVQRTLVVEYVVRDGGVVRARVRSTGARSIKVYGVGIMVVGRGHSAFCSCEDWQERGVVYMHTRQWRCMSWVLRRTRAAHAAWWVCCCSFKLQLLGV